LFVQSALVTAYS